MRKICVNWRELNDLSSRTTKNAEDLEKEINKMIEIVDSLSECWQGQDAENFKATTKTYLENLKFDREYIDNWANTFKRSALRYNGGVEEGVTKLKQVNKEILEPNPNEVMINE